MTQSKLIILSEDPVLIQKAKDFAASCGLKCEVEKPPMNASLGFVGGRFNSSVPSLNKPNHHFSREESGNVVLFPQKKEIPKISDLEIKAIKEAIEFYGNLTVAAKALGIGRATLYRKVKVYNIKITNIRSSKRTVA